MPGSSFCLELSRCFFLYKDMRRTTDFKKLRQHLYRVGFTFHHCKMSTELKVIFVTLEILWAGIIWGVAAECPDGFTLNPGDSYCYKLISDPMTWTDARMYCHGFNGDLAKIDNPNTQNFISDLIDLYPRSNYWIGANDVIEEDKFQWVDYSSVTWDNIGGNQPNGGRLQNCLTHTGKLHRNKWHDKPCSERYPCVCQRNPGPSTNERRWATIDSAGLSHRQILRQGSTRTLLECAQFCQLDPSCDLFAFNKTNTNSQEANCFATMLLAEASSSDSWNGYLTYLREV